MKVIDVFCYNGEPILELRLEYLQDVVDEFVLVESKYTFSGKVKDAFYSDALQHPKVTVLKLDYAPPVADEEWCRERSGSSSFMEEGCMDHWFREQHQRDYPKAYIMNKYAAQDYIVICSDVDEIPRKELLISLKQHGNGQLHTPIYLHMAMLMYNMGWQTDEQWLRAFVVNKEGFCNAASMDEMRRAEPYRVAPYGGWHCSYFLNSRNLARKLQAFSHQEYNKQEYTDLAHCRKCLLTGKDVLGRGELKAYAGQVPELFKKFNDKILFLQKYS
ncbi:glycosyl transferase [Tribonema minus]|uniref:Glycosyl transferase n=1 Tax=Tribonema minus TaxID=303371 RepID=A0A836CF14_9STRA|nr:glycosyl transferase [Tribonema minus]